MIEIFESVANAYLQFVSTVSGLMVVCLIASIGAIIFFTQCVALINAFVRPAIEHGFYHRVLNHWLGSFYTKHKIIGTFIRVQGLGNSVVDAIACMIGTFVVVAFLSSACTALIIHSLSEGFVHSFYLVFLVASIAMLSWVLVFNLRYFYKLAHKLK